MPSIQSITMLTLDTGKILLVLEKLALAFKAQETQQLDVIHTFRQNERDYERLVMSGTDTELSPPGNLFKGLQLEPDLDAPDVGKEPTYASTIKPPDAALLLAAQQSRSAALTALATLESCKELLRSLPTKVPTVVGLRALIEEVNSQVEILESESSACNVEYLETYLLQLDAFLYGIGFTQNI